MRFGELIASLEMSMFPIIGLLLFVAAFAMVGWRVARSTREEMTHHAALPLGDAAGDSGTDEIDGGTGR